VEVLVGFILVAVIVAMRESRTGRRVGAAPFVGLSALVAVLYFGASRLI
jgi:hypothetical protein